MNQSKSNYSQNRHFIKEKAKAFEKIKATYNNDPAYWMDILNANTSKDIKSHAIQRLLELGWKVEKIGKKKSR